MRGTGNPPRVATRVVVAVAASVAIASAVAIPMAALGYFTDSTSASGGFRLHLMPTTEMTETYGGMVKTISVANPDGAIPSYVRARAFSALPVTNDGDGWEVAADGWVYYREPLGPGEAATPLSAAIALPTGEGDGAPRAGDKHEVTMVQEATPVAYDQGGNAYGYAECWQRNLGLDGNGGGA